MTYKIFGMSEFVLAPFAVPREFAAELVKIGGLLDISDDVKQLGEAVLSGLHGQKCDSEYKLVGYLIFTKAFNLDG